MVFVARSIAALAFLSVLTACEPTFPKDLVTFCRVVGEVDAAPGLTAAQKLARIGERRPEYATTSLLETRDIWAEAEAQQGEDKYRYLVAAAKKFNTPDWRCPAYGTLLNIAQVDALGRTPSKPSAPSGAVANDAHMPTAATTLPAVSEHASRVAAEPLAKKKKAKSKRARLKKSRG
jgi:hypothetical protein